jgi:proteic killer suppression protein
VLAEPPASSPLHASSAGRLLRARSFGECLSADRIVLVVTLGVINGLRYASCVIQSFGADTERVWRRERVRRFGSDLQRRANRKLLIINAAETLNDLRVPPGNRLEQLRGDRAGQYSIRINDQWRICFTWTALGAADVEITDYH